MARDDEQRTFVLRTVEEREIRFVRLWFTDVLGFLKSSATPAEELPEALEEGSASTGPRSTGSRVSRKHDMIARPDASTFQILPWRAPTRPAWAACSATSTRPMARRSRATPGWCSGGSSRVRGLGFSFYAGPEIEFFLFDGPTDPKPLDVGSYFDLTPLDIGSDFLAEGDHIPRGGRDPGEGSRTTRWRPRSTRFTSATHRRDRDERRDHDVPPGREGGGGASWACTRPSCPSRSRASTAPGCTRTCRCSRAIATPSSIRPASTRSRRSPRCFIAGLLRHARAITAVTNQWTNSYKRLVPGYEAPVHVGWGARNRSALVRVPLHEAAQGSGLPDRVPGAGPGVQPVPRLRAHPRGRSGRDRSRGRAAAGDDRTTCGRWARRSGSSERNRSRPAREPSRGARGDGQQRARPGGPRRAPVRVVHREQAGGMGRIQDVRHGPRARAEPPEAVGRLEAAPRAAPRSGVARATRVRPSPR